MTKDLATEKYGGKEILKAKRSNSNGIRQFKISSQLFASKDVVSIIDGQENNFTEPLLHKKLLKRKWKKF